MNEETIRMAVTVEVGLYLLRYGRRPHHSGTVSKSGENLPGNRRLICPLFFADFNRLFNLFEYDCVCKERK